MHKEKIIKPMDRETKDIIRLIAGIQIESLTSLKRDVEQGINIADDLIKRLLQIDNDEIKIALDAHIQMYVEIEQTPQLIQMLNEYQLMVCSHILFRMEDEWIHSNSQGVFGTWAILRRVNLNHHPELNLLKI